MNETDKLLEEIMSNPMHEPYVTISWCPEDVKELRPNWTDEQCMKALEQIGGYLEDRSIEFGWDVLENLLDIDDSEDNL